MRNGTYPLKQIYNFPDQNGEGSKISAILNETGKSIFIKEFFTCKKHQPKSKDRLTTYQIKKLSIVERFGSNQTLVTMSA